MVKRYIRPFKRTRPVSGGKGDVKGHYRNIKKRITYEDISSSFNWGYYSQLGNFRRMNNKFVQKHGYGACFIMSSILKSDIPGNSKIVFGDYLVDPDDKNSWTRHTWIETQNGEIYDANNIENENDVILITPLEIGKKRYTTKFAGSGKFNTIDEFREFLDNEHIVSKHEFDDLYNEYKISFKGGF